MSCDFTEAIKLQQKMLNRYQYRDDDISIRNFRSTLIALESLLMIKELGLDLFMTFKAREIKHALHRDKENPSTGET